MEELHRELLKKRQKYLAENVIMEQGLLEKLKEKGVFTSTMANVLMTEKDTDKQLTRLLDMIPKRGPAAYIKFMECLQDDYPWVVENFRQREIEMIAANAKLEVSPDVRRMVKDYLKELAITIRINKAQQKAIEDFLCKHIGNDSNLNNTRMFGGMMYNIHRQCMSVIPISSLDESDQMDLKNLQPETITLERIEKEVQLLVHRVQELQGIIDACYENLGEANKEQELPDLVYALRKTFLEKDIRIEEVKNQLLSTTRQIRLAKDKARKAHEATQKTEEEKEELSKSLDMLKLKIQKLQDERQRMGMKMAFDTSTLPSLTAPSSPSSSRTRSSRSHELPKGSSRSRRLDDRMADF